MKKPTIKFLNTILALGLLLLFVGVIFILAYVGASRKMALGLTSLFILLSGLVFIYIYICFSRTPFNLFSGIALSTNGLFLLIMSREIFPMELSQLWPLTVLFTSLALFIASRTKSKTFKLSYDFTSICLFVIGIFLLLFSLDIIKYSFSQVVFLLFPIILILSGVFLLVLFAQRKAFLDMLPDEMSKNLESEEDFEEEGEDL